MSFRTTLQVPHPIPYQGSKRIIAADILCFFQPDTETLYEPFVGSAAVSIAAAFRNAAKCFVLSDWNDALTALWQEIVFRPEALIDGYSALWLAEDGDERAFYDKVRKEFNSSHQPDRFLYLLARCVKASVRYNAYGEFNQSPDNRRRGTRPVRMADYVRRTSSLLSGRTEVRSGDYREIIRHATAADLIYIDPPYQGVCGNKDPRYFKDVCFSEFSQALADMNDRGLSYIVSYDGYNTLRTYGKTLPQVAATYAHPH